MRIIKLAQVANRVEKLLDPSVVEEWRDLKEYHQDLYDQYCDLIMAFDPNDISHVNKRKELAMKRREIKQEIEKIEEPARKIIRERHEQHRQDQAREREELEKRDEQSQNDTRYQIRIENAVKDWPRTENIRSAGYMLQDGSLLSFSHGYGNRDMDHREITSISDELSDGTSGMYQFMNSTGAIRLQTQSDNYMGFEWKVKPTFDQKREIMEHTRDENEIIIDDMGESYEFSSVWEMSEKLGWF
jgi:hypothetical protein